MENTKTLVNGLIVKQNPSRPDFVIGSLSFKIEDFAKFVKEHNKNGWLNVDLLTSKAGKPYAALNTWEPESKANNFETIPNDQVVKGNDDDLPF